MKKVRTDIYMHIETTCFLTLEFDAYIISKQITKYKDGVNRNYRW